MVNRQQQAAVVHPVANEQGEAWLSPSQSTCNHKLTTSLPVENSVVPPTTKVGPCWLLPLLRPSSLHVAAAVDIGLHCRHYWSKHRTLRRHSVQAQTTSPLCASSRRYTTTSCKSVACGPLPHACHRFQPHTPPAIEYRVCHHCAP